MHIILCTFPVCVWCTYESRCRHEMLLPNSLSPHWPHSAAVPSSSFSCLSFCHCPGLLSSRWPFLDASSQTSLVHFWFRSSRTLRCRSPSLSGAGRNGRQWWGRWSSQKMPLQNRKLTLTKEKQGRKNNSVRTWTSRFKLQPLFK